MTTVPRTCTVSKARRMASTATWSAPFRSPRPIMRPAASAAASVTRTSSNARFLSICLPPRIVCCRFRRGDRRMGREQREQVRREAAHPALAVDTGVVRLAGDEDEAVGLALDAVVEDHAHGARRLDV